MVPAEVMTSESQERMLAIVTPAQLPDVLDVCERWEVRASVIGTVTSSGRLRILSEAGGEVLADVPAASLEEEKPLYDRPRRRPATLDALQADDPSGLDPGDAGDDLCALLVDPAWIYRQYDHQLFLNTVVAPGAGDAAVLRLKAPGVPPTSRAMALSSDGNARWCALDPRAGTAMIVAEACLNVACAGARPVALVNCLNFGNPEHPEVMWQLSESIDGMAAACRALGIPVIGGNVSLYNESRGADIDPTPIVAVLGLIDALDAPPPAVGVVEDGDLWLLGPLARDLGGSRWAAECRGHRGGTLPPLDLTSHAALLGRVATLASHPDVVGMHDVADGGLAVALAEMAMRSSIGVVVEGVADHAALFSEAPSRVVVCTRPGAPPLADGAVRLGRAGGDRFVVEGLIDRPLADLVAAWQGRIPSALAGARD
jgi:phosphoribosylformylglycinamidine synthase